MDDLVERCARVAELDTESLDRLRLMIGDVEESVGIDHLVNCLADKTSAAGDGVIEYSGWNGAYGKYIRIKHKISLSEKYQV